MDFTFGVITGEYASPHLCMLIDSIERLNIPNYEIVIVGNTVVQPKHGKIIPFDEHAKPKWITRKKNLITEHAQYNNIVYVHDYIVFNSDWYDGFVKFGDQWDICMNRIYNADGTRFRDWTLWCHNGNVVDTIIGRQCLLPYNVDYLSRFMYISGAYWVAKKHVMQEFPLDERLVWGQGEDVLWSVQVREKYRFTMNPWSSVQLLRYKDRAFVETSRETLALLEQFK